MNYGVRAADVQIVSDAHSGADAAFGVTGAGDAVPVSPADMPDDLPVPSFSGLGASVTAAIDLNTGTRIGEDGSIVHQSPGYAYEGLEVEAQDARSALFAAHSDALKSEEMKKHLEAGDAVVSAALGGNQDQAAIRALLEQYGAKSVQVL